MFHFEQPDWLWLLLAAPFGVALVGFGSRRRRRDWLSLGQSGRPAGDGAWGWLAAMILLILALAQPRWGRIPGQGPLEGHDVVFLVDASRSMAAEDAVPDRMALAIDAATSLLKALGGVPGDRSSVVAFAGRGVVLCPLTENLEAVADALLSIRPGQVEPGGTDLGAGLEAALDAFDEEEHLDGRTIVVFSDGEDHVGSWSSLVDRLRAHRIIVHSVAIGDPDRPHPIPSTVSRDGKTKPADSTRRSDVAFEALAKATGGAMIPLGLAPSTLESLYRTRIEPMARRRRDDRRPLERVERFPVFVLMAISVGLVGSWPGLSRRRTRRLAFASLALALPAMGAGDDLRDRPASLVADGRNAYDSGRYVEALDAFDRASKLDPVAAIPRYDSAAALYQLGRFPEAITRYVEARERGDAALAVKVDYALGNAYLGTGDVLRAIGSYDACIASTHSSPVSRAVRQDAATNRAFAVSRMNSRAQEPDETEPGGARPPDKRRKSPGRGQPGSDDGSESSPSPSNGSTDPEGDGTGRRGAGGAGGSGEAPPDSASTRARLDQSLKDIKDARKNRPPEPLPKSPGGMGKDW